MANIFSNAVVRNISTATTIYTVPESTTSTLIGLIICNVDATKTVKVTVAIIISGNTYHLVKDLPILPGSSLELIEGKIVMLANEFIRLTSTGGDCDAVLSVLEAS